MIDLYLACMKQGIIFVPINILYREREIGHILSDAEPKAVIARGEFPGAAPVWQVDELPDAEPRRPDPTLTGDTPAALVYTSGTTGTSKGAILTHNNFAANAINLLACWQITEADRLLLPLPLFHVHGLGNGLHCWLIGGCRMRLLERFEHQKAAEVFQRFPSHAILRRAHHVRPAARPAGGCGARDRAGHAPVRLRLGAAAGAGAGRVPRAFRPRHSGTLRHDGDAHESSAIRTWASGARARWGFRCRGSRCGCWRRMVHRCPTERRRDPSARPERVRRATGGARRRRARRSWTATSAPAIWRGSPDGYYTLLGRRSDLIISGGFNIYPREIEEFLQELEGVAEAAVVGVPDRIRGEVPVAYIVAAGELRLEDLEQQCRASGFVQSAAAIHRGREAAAHRAGEDSKASADPGETKRSMIDREQAWQILCEFTKSKACANTRWLWKLV